MREGRTKLLSQRLYALTVTDALLSEGKGSSANHSKFGFMQNAKLLLTQSIRPCRTLFRFVPILRKKAQRRTQELKLLKRYIDHKLCTVKENPLDDFEYANSLHKNIQLTLETPNVSGRLAFPDPNINLTEERKIRCDWYQKSTDTGIILNFRSCAPLQH